MQAAMAGPALLGRPLSVSEPPRFEITDPAAR